MISPVYLAPLLRVIGLPTTYLLLFFASGLIIGLAIISFSGGALKICIPYIRSFSCAISVSCGYCLSLVSSSATSGVVCAWVPSSSSLSDILERWITPEGGET